MCPKSRRITVLVCLAICGVALAQQHVSSTHRSGTGLATERGSLSFRGLRVAVGETSPAHDIVIRNHGDSPLRGLNAVTRGDFVITASSCTQTLEPAGSGKDTCAISVAFRPTTSGLRTGDLTVQAAGVRAMVVPLVAGTPIDFGTVAQGETLVQWAPDPVSTTAISGSVTGPFSIALQDTYTYGSIDGITFAGSASSDAATGPVSLGVEFLAATLGSQAGSITLSDGTTYAVTANVVSANVATLSPASASFDAFGLVGGNSSLNPVQSVSGPYQFVFTNDTGSTLGITSIAADAPFRSTNTCGMSLAPGTSCQIEVVFAPTATGLASGNLTVTTGAGTYSAALSGTGSANPAQVSITPSANYFTDLSAPGIIAPETVTIQNLSAVHSVLVVLQACPLGGGPCPQITANTCSTIPALGSCQFQLQYSSPGSFDFSPVGLTLTTSSGATGYSYSINSLLRTSVTGQGIELLPQSLSFPPTPVGGASPEQLVTVTNVTDQPMVLSANESEYGYEFSAESACGLLQPSQSCTLHVRYLPLGAGSTDRLVPPFVPYGASIDFVGYSPSGTQTASGFLSLHGYGIPATTVASPSYPAPIKLPISFGPVADGTLVQMPLAVKNTGTAPLVLNEITVGGANRPTAFTVDPTQCSQPITPGGQCNLTVNWLPWNCPSEPPEGPYCYDDTFLQISGNALSSTDGYLLEGLYTYAPAATPGQQPSLPFFGTDFGFTQVGSLATSSPTFGYGALPPDLQITVTGAGFSLVNGCAGLTGFCTVQVGFKPTAPGFYHGTLRTFASTGGLVTANLSGTGIPMQLQVTPLPVVFPNTFFGQSETEKITLTNVSGSALPLGQPYLGRGTSSAFSISGNTCASSLATAASCTLSITFGASAAGAADTLGINFGIGELETIELLASAAFVTVTPSAASFGSLTLGQTASRVFTVQEVPNPYFPFLATRFVTITGTNASDFTISANTCAPFVLSPGGTCTVTVQFAPTAAAVETATLTVYSDQGSATATLSGTGVSAPPATVQPLRLHFHRRLVGSVSETKKIFLHNPGANTLVLPAPPTITGDNPLDFRLSGTCGSIPSGSFCALGVQFTPTAEGDRSATLSIPTGGSTNTSVSVSLQGIGCVRDRREERHDRDDSDCREKESWHEHDRDGERPDQRN